MNKFFIIFLFAVAGISSCKKENKNIFDKSADERLNEKLTAYQVQLSSAQYGWKAILKTDSGRGAIFSFYFKFNNENRVTMLSDFDSSSAVVFKESSFRLKALQQPSLIFDTYSYLHVLSDPDETVNGGIRGAGLLSDFEFYFDSTSADSIHLVGRYHGSKMLLVKATQAEGDAYNNGQLAAGLYINKILTYFKRLTIGSQVYEISIDPVSRTFRFSGLDANGNIQTFSTSYYFTLDGISFLTPFVSGGQTISDFTNLTWTPSTQIINLIAGGTDATITGAAKPLKVDVDAPRRWRQQAIDNDSTYWISGSGFHVNGVDDAFGITTLTKYYYLIYFPAFGTNNDFFGPIFINAAGTGLDLLYGTAPTPTFTPDGRAVFNELGTYGTPPSSGPAALTKNQLYIPAGYYFVQTSTASYDMVSAADAKAWITWGF